MSRLRDYHKQLSLIIKQRRSIINIQTDDCPAEVERVKEIFKEQNIPLELFKKENINIWLPDGSGLRRLYGGQDQGNSLCDSLRMLPIRPNETFKSILIIRNLHYYFDSQSDSIPQITSLLERFYFANEKRLTSDRSIVIIISPKFSVPQELANCVYTIIPPYPDEQDIEDELGLSALCDIKEYYNKDYEPERKPYIFSSVFFKSTDGVVFEDNKRNLINALKGLRIHQINKLLAYGEIPYEIRGFDIKTFEESKKRLVADSGLLKVEDVPEHYDEYVGDIESLKAYIKKEKSVIHNRSYYNENMPLPKGILLVGPPGCGKSETSKAIASILDLPLYSMDMGKLLGSLMGQSEHNFDKALSIAEAAQPCVLRIDEIEKAFAGSGGNENEQTMTHIVGHFLTWMQERKNMVYLVATANNLEMLRPEFLRKGRWDEIFYLTYPTAEGMSKILESGLKKYALRMEDGESFELDDNNKAVIKNPIGEMTKEIINSFYKNNKTIKVSGAEIVDIVEQIYKNQFNEAIDSHVLEEDKIRAVETAKTLSINSFKEKLETLSHKKKDAVIDRLIDKEILDLEINQLIKNKSSDKQFEGDIKKELETKYNDKEIKRLVSSELDSIEINSILSNNCDKLNEDKKQEIKTLLQKKYNKEHLIEDELREIKMSILVQEDRLDDEKKNALRKKLKEKYKDEHPESYYEARGYKSAAWRINVEDLDKMASQIADATSKVYSAIKTDLNKQVDVLKKIFKNTKPTQG